MFRQEDFTVGAIGETIPGPGRRAYPAETPLLQRKPESFADFYQQPSPVIGEAYPVPAMPGEPYLRSVGGRDIIGSSESPGVMWRQETEPSFLRYDYSPPRQHIQRLVPEPSATEVVRMKESSMVADAKPLPPVFERGAYDEIQPVPELALMSAGHFAETAPPAIMRIGSESGGTEHIEAEPGEVETESTTPDIDDLARQVYPILKRRLARERERTLGIS